MFTQEHQQPARNNIFFSLKTLSELKTLIKDGTINPHAKDAANKTLIDYCIDKRDNGIYDEKNWHDLIEFFKILKENKVNFNQTDNSGNTYVHKACEKENRIIIQILYNFGASFSKKNNLEQTPLEYAKSMNKNIIVSFFEKSKFIEDGGFMRSTYQAIDQLPVGIKDRKKIYEVGLPIQLRNAPHDSNINTLYDTICNYTVRKCTIV